MKTNTLFIIIIMLSITTMGKAQISSDGNTDSTGSMWRPKFEVEYTSELQTDFHRNKWGNLLQIRLSQPIARNVSIDLATVSVASTDESSLANDLQTFSNIDSDNLPLALSVACLDWKINQRHTLYGGIRRVDEDYFCSPGLAFFTNSSCGIFPTISSNNDIATYPNAALGVHYLYTTEKINVNASLYNGLGYHQFTGRDNVFRFCPKSDGIFAMAQVEYQHKGSSYYLGTSQHYVEQSLSPTIWAYAEQSLGKNVTLLGAYSHSFGKNDVCRDFAGVGCNYAFPKAELGVFADYTKVSGVNEFATELTCSVPVCNFVTLLPTLHVINTDIRTKCIGMLRLSVAI